MHGLKLLAVKTRLLLNLVIQKRTKYQLQIFELFFSLNHPPPTIHKNKFIRKKKGSEGISDLLHELGAGNLHRLVCFSAFVG